MARGSPFSTALVGIALCLGCANGNPDIGNNLFPPVGSTASLSRDVQPVFNTNCALSGCHDSFSLANGMSLEASDLFDPVIGIVGVPSTDNPALARVMPGDSDASYLINKLEGTQAAVGGGGPDMPFGQAPLPAQTIQVIRDWIDQGAQNN